MSSKRKISVIILGRDEALKKALITNILGKDLLKQFKRAHKQIEIYENDTYEVTFTPDLYSPCEDIHDLFSYHRYPDMCLLVVEDGLSPDIIWKQIEDLSKKTGKPTEEFTVLLPLSSKPTHYLFNSCTIQQVFDNLHKLAEERNLTQINTRCTHPHFSAPHTEMGKAGRDTGIKVNLVLLGMAGAGKSASGNIILGKKVFLTTPSSSPVTTECQMAETVIKGVHVRVIDTPDIFKDEIGPLVRNTHVKRCKELCESEPCVYVLVMQVSRLVDGEKDILKKLEKAFGIEVEEQTIILFTRGDDLQRGKITLDNFVHSCQPGLREMIQKCGNRCVLFEKDKSSSDQVEKLMDTVISMIQEQQK